MTCALCDFETLNAKTSTCKKSSCQTCTAAARVDEEINQAVATLQRLLAKRRGLRTEQSGVHDPLRRLPVELGSYIFELLLPRRDKWGNTLGVGVMPTYLASICRHWRDIAWSNPLLWSTIHIVARKQVPTSASRINFVCDWILRSQTSPLTLHIVVKPDGEEELKSVVDAISRSSDRWCSLSLDIPPDLLRAFHHRNFQYHRLRRLRVSSWPDSVGQPVPLFNPKVSPEVIDVCGVSFQWLQISWNHLTSATFDGYNFADIVPLFQHASRMTYCRLSDAGFQGGNFSITHRSLKVLSLLNTFSWDDALILGCLTLPSLQEFHTNEFPLLLPEFLPALVRRSLCPLNRITLAIRMDGEYGALPLKPYPGVTDLLLEAVPEDEDVIKKLLLEECFPDLLHLTLRRQPFKCLWEMGTIPLLLDHRNPPRGMQNEGKLPKIIVEDQSDIILNSDDWKQLEVMGIKLRGDGFEFL